jgi:hypothetical protein
VVDPKIFELFDSCRFPPLIMDTAEGGAGRARMGVDCCAIVPPPGDGLLTFVVFVPKRVVEGK